MATYVLLFLFILLNSLLPPPAQARVEGNNGETGDVRASWYGPGFHGKKTASGKRFSEHNPTMFAHRFLPLGTMIQVTNLANGKVVYGWVLDRGPFRKKNDGVILDVSKAAAQKLNFIREGLTPVDIKLLWMPGLNLD